MIGWLSKPGDVRPGSISGYTFGVAVDLRSRVYWVRLEAGVVWVVPPEGRVYPAGPKFTHENTRVRGLSNRGCRRHVTHCLVQYR
jgi:hypothetical protein